MVRYRNTKTGQTIEREQTQAVFDRSSRWERLEGDVEVTESGPSPDDLVKGYLEPGSLPTDASVESLTDQFEGKHLEQLAEARDLATSGTKADVAERLIAHDKDVRENPPGTEPNEGNGEGTGNGEGDQGGDDVDLIKLGREELNARATAAGVTEPEKLQNKAAVVEAIQKASA